MTTLLRRTFPAQPQQLGAPSTYRGAKQSDRGTERLAHGLGRRLLVIFVIAVAGALYFLIARPDRGVGTHLHDAAEPTGAERG